MANFVRGGFSFNGVSNHGILIQHRPSFSSHKRDAEQQHIYGLNGDWLSTYDSYTNGEETIKFLKKGNSREEQLQNEQAIKELFDVDNYVEMIFWYDPTRLRFVYPTSLPKFEYGYGNHTVFTVDFTYKPLRYDVENNYKLFTQRGTFYNPYKHISLPTFRINGNGDIQLIVNGIPFSVVDIDGHIDINSETYTATRDSENANRLVKSLDFPYFNPGNNTIVWSGDVTSIEVWGWCGTL